MIFQNDLQFYTNLAGGQPDRQTESRWAIVLARHAGDPSAGRPVYQKEVLFSMHVCPLSRPWFMPCLCLCLSFDDPQTPLLATLFGEQCVTKQQNKREQRTRQLQQGIECRDRDRDSEETTTSLLTAPQHTKCIFSSARFLLWSLLFVPSVLVVY